MIVNYIRLTGRHSALVALSRGDPVLMVRSILCWLRSRLVSGAVCACVSACLLLHYCSVCQVRNYRHIDCHSAFYNVMVLHKDHIR